MSDTSEENRRATLDAYSVFLMELGLLKEQLQLAPADVDQVGKHVRAVLVGYLHTLREVPDFGDAVAQTRSMLALSHNPDATKVGAMNLLKVLSEAIEDYIK